MSLLQLMNEIPPDELGQFEKNLRVGKAGDIVIREGKSNDNTLYLLRVGKIGVYRLIGEKTEQIVEMEALAFFGEMELMENEGCRLSTCAVNSEYAIFYAFQNPDIKTIIKNSVWGELLVTRLCLDLHLVANLNVQNKVTNAQAVSELESTRHQIAFLLSALDSLHQQVACDYVLSKQDWLYVNGVYEMVRNFVKVRLPEVSNLVSTISHSSLEKMNEEGLLPKKLKELIGMVKPTLRAKRI